MIKTMKSGITHKGKICRAGELLSLPAQEEERLVREGWAAFVESWPAGQAAPQPVEKEEGPAGQAAPQPVEKEEGPAGQAAPQPVEKEEGPAASVPEDGPKTGAPEEQENKPHTRSRGTRKSGTPRRTNETDL